MHPKVGNIVWTCAEDNIFRGGYYYKAIRLCGLCYQLFEEEEGGGVREVIYGYPYLKHITFSWSGDF